MVRLAPGSGPGLAICQGGSSSAFDCVYDCADSVLDVPSAGCRKRVFRVWSEGVLSLCLFGFISLDFGIGLLREESASGPGQTFRGASSISSCWWVKKMVPHTSSAPSFRTNKNLRY